MIKFVLLNNTVYMTKLSNCKNEKIVRFKINFFLYKIL